MGGDWEGPMEAQSRRMLRDEHADSGTLVIGTHYASPTAVWIESLGGGWYFRAFER
jgi:hypothetical protein